MYIITREKVLKQDNFYTVLIGFYTSNNCKFYIYYTNNEKAYKQFLYRNKRLYNNVNDVITYLLRYKGEINND